MRELPAEVMLSFVDFASRPAAHSVRTAPRYVRHGEGHMARQLNITYFADRDMLGLVSDEDYEQFKDILLEALHKEWPKAAVAVEDGEHAGVEVGFADGGFPSAKAEAEAKSDVESRVHEIANDVIDEREWASDEEFDAYEEEYDEELEERRSRGDDEDY